MNRRHGRIAIAISATIAIVTAACSSGVQRQGTTITVAPGGDLQAAIDQAHPGDTIILPAGETFTGTFTLPEKTGSGVITIESSAIAKLPAGVRVTPASAASMPKIVTARPGQPAIRTRPRAHHFALVGLEIMPAKGVQVFDLVSLGDGGEKDLTNVPHDFLIDRCYVHGRPGDPLKRAIALNSAETTVRESHVSDAKAPAQDAQAISGWNGPGPFHILDNYLEGAAENVMFGGAVPAIQGLIPSDIEIRGNLVVKPRYWKDGPWSIKNLFELKNAQRVVIDGNVFENNWLNAQTGFAILFNCVDPSGWARVEDIQFTNNVIAHSSSGLNVSGSQPDIGCEMSNLLFRNNLWFDIDGRTWGGDGRLFQVLNGPRGIVIDHNTGIQSGTLMSFDGVPGAKLVFTNNLTMYGAYGIFGTGAGTGMVALKRYYGQFDVARNVMVAPPFPILPGQYPAENFFPDKIEAVGLTDPASGDYSLRPSSPFRGKALDGTDIGVDMVALRKAIRDKY